VSDLGKDLEAKVSFIQVRNAIDPDVPSPHHNGSEATIANAGRQIVCDGENLRVPDIPPARSLSFLPDALWVRSSACASAGFGFLKFSVHGSR